MGVTQVQRLRWDPRLSTLVKATPKDKLDGAPFVAGVATVLKQFHSSHTHTFLAYLGQYIRSIISASPPPSAKVTSVDRKVVNVLHFLEEFCKFSYLSRAAIESIVPPYI